MFDDLIDIHALPTLDLHGEYCDIAKVLIQDFINDNIFLKNKYIVIIHGKGTGLLKKTTHELLKKNKNVIDYKINIFNDGETIIKLRR